MSVPYTIPQEAVAVGFWEAGRGILAHDLGLDAGRIANY
jgi:coenzyme F420-reducing hydrogenase alpha subunit